MKRRILVIFMTFLCLFSFLCYGVVAAVSVPDGFDLPVTLDSFSYRTNTGSFSFQSGYGRPNWLESFVNNFNGTVHDLFGTFYSDFQRLGYVNKSLQDSNPAFNVTFSYSFDSSYSELYIVMPVYQLRNSNDSSYILLSNLNGSLGALTSANYDVNWTTIYPGGPGVRLSLYTYRVQSSFSVDMVFRYRSDDWGSYSGSVAFPVYAPLAFTTEGAANAFVRDKLGSISDQLNEIEDGISGTNSRLDGIGDSISGTNSRLDELEDGLFSLPPGWSEYYESVAAGISDQSSLENSVDQEANSIIQDGLGGYDLNVSDVQSGIFDALGDDPGGSEFIHFFQWIWTINPLLPIEVGLVILFFAVFLLIRIYP